MIRFVAAVALVAALSACGSTVRESAAPPPPAQSSVVLARPAGTSGPLAAYDGHSFGRRFELPSGVLAANGSSFFALRGGRLVRYDPSTGTATRSYAVGSDWRLAAVSSTGRWLALSRGQTQIRVLDARSGRTTHRLTLRGDFLVETIARDGSFLFLQQTFADGRYAVRGYDLRAGTLLQGSLATKGETVLMAGVATGTVASPDGRWLLTVYVDTAKGKAFVHALNLVDRLPLCIDLPPCADCDAETLGRWGIALSPDGRSLFAANPTLGRTAEIHLPSARVIHESRFRARPGDGPTRAAVAPDGSKVLFTNGRDAWTYDTHRGFAQSLPVAAARIDDLGISADGRRAWFARPGKAALAQRL
jgi:hypothetical protein